MIEKWSKFSRPASRHQTPAQLPHSTHSATGPSSLSSPLMRPTGGCQFGLGKVGEVARPRQPLLVAGVVCPPCLILIQPLRKQETPGALKPKDHPPPSPSLWLPSFRIRGGKGFKLVSGGATGLKLERQKPEHREYSPYLNPRLTFLILRAHLSTPPSAYSINLSPDPQPSSLSC